MRVLAIYGGRAYEPQVEALKKGVDVIVGTPGRLLDLAGQKKLDLSHVKALVLDEADEMLDLGFLPDVERIIQLLPAKRQTMLFSATMPGAVIGLARRYMSQPTHIRATSPDDEGATVANTTQHVFRAHSMDKPELVSRILQADGRGLAMVFCRTKRTAADIADQLAQRGFASGAVHGDLGQGAREQALRAFRNGKVDVLVCTDVAARGIDVEGVTHVINYQSPEDEKTYLHRIGRTGRAGAKGIAVTLVDWDDIPRWQLINKALDLRFHDPPETYSTSPHLYEELSIPAGHQGRPAACRAHPRRAGGRGGRGPRRDRRPRPRASPAAVRRPPRSEERPRAPAPRASAAAPVAERRWTAPAAGRRAGHPDAAPRRAEAAERTGAAHAAPPSPCPARWPRPPTRWRPRPSRPPARHRPGCRRRRHPRPRREHRPGRPTADRGRPRPSRAVAVPRAAEPPADAARPGGGAAAAAGASRCAVEADARRPERAARRARAEDAPPRPPRRRRRSPPPKKAAARSPPTAAAARRGRGGQAARRRTRVAERRSGGAAGRRAGAEAAVAAEDGRGRRHRAEAAPPPRPHDGRATTES